MTAPSNGDLRDEYLANRAVPHMSQSQRSTPKHSISPGSANGLDSQRRMTLNNSMLITPSFPALAAQGELRTWVNSRWKNPLELGHFSVEINTRQPKLCWLDR